MTWGIEVHKSSTEGPMVQATRHTHIVGKYLPELSHAPFREIVLMAVRLPVRGGADHLADASACPTARAPEPGGRDAVFGIACGRRA